MFKKPEPESDNDSQEPPSQATLCGGVSILYFSILVLYEKCNQ